jgi:hypothetical protein
MEVAGANRRWRCQFRYRGTRRESAVAQLFSLGGFRIMKRSTIIFSALLVASIIAFVAFRIGRVLGDINGTVMIKEYERGVHEVVTVVDELAIADRTNDIHQVCQNLQGFYMMRPSDITNLDRVIEDAESRVSKQPFTRLPK